MLGVLPAHTGRYSRLTFCWLAFIQVQTGKPSDLESWYAGGLALVTLTITWHTQVKLTITEQYWICFVG